MLHFHTNINHYIIHGTLDSCGSNTLLIFVHGITGNKDEHHYFNAVPFFNQNNLDTFRFTFYSREDNTRSLSDSSLSSHADDIKKLINFFKDKYKNIILIGHSLGALAILNSDLSDISKLILWDPSTGFNNLKDKSISYNSNLDKYILRWGMDILISKQMLEEWKNTDLKKLTKNISIPCKFIFASNGGKHKSWIPYLKDIRVKNDYIIIDGASHCFIEEGVEQKLFKETLKWIKH